MEINQEFINCKLETSNRLTKIETILENQNTVLEQILEQSKKTNGRVTKIEYWKENLTGKIAGITIAISVIVTAVGFILSHLKVIGI